MNSNRWLFRILLSLVILVGYASSQDSRLQVFSNTANIALGWNWSQANHVWLFRNPLTPNATMNIQIRNNNPSNSHAGVVQVFVTIKPTAVDYSNNTGFWFPVLLVCPSSGSSVPQLSFSVTVAANSSYQCYAQTTFASQLAIVQTGFSTAAGNPDTFDIDISLDSGSNGQSPTTNVQGTNVQGNSVIASQQFPVVVGGYLNPGTTTTVFPLAVGGQAGGIVLDSVNPNYFGNGFLLTPASNFAAPQGIKIGGNNKELVIANNSLSNFGNNGAVTAAVHTDIMEFGIQAAFSGTVSYLAFGKVTNPGTNATILHHFNQANGTQDLTPKRLILSCSAVCELAVNKTTAQGTTCTTLTIRSTELWGGASRSPAATDVAENACATQPAVGYQMFDLYLPAGGFQTLDLSGFDIGNTVSGGGIDVVNVTNIAAGLASATIEFVEE
jgi:hypothetical protein